MNNLFISYSPRDKNEMLVLREKLIEMGYRPWIDPNPRPGQDWRFDIDDAIRNSDVVLVIVTPAAAESTYVTYEWSLALGLGLRVVPLIFKNARMHPRLQTLEHFDTNAFREIAAFWQYFGKEFPKIVQSAPRPHQMQGQPAPPAAPPAPPAAPSAAPQPFTRSVMPSQPGYWLVVRRGPQLNQQFRLAKDIITLGRDDANDITISDPELSRVHLKLHWQGSGYAVEDLQSTNGTRINGGQRIHGIVPLQPGQALMLGDGVIVSYEVVS